MLQTNIEERQRILRQAFWSGETSYRRWRGIMRRGPEGHRKAFWQSFLYLPVRWLLQEIGEERFIEIWPEIRDEFDMDSPEERTALDAWDAIWGMIATGDSQYPVDPEVAMISRMRREILQLVVCNPGISAYSVAKKTERNYSRVYKDIQLLIEKGMVESRPKAGSTRREMLLIPRRSLNARLARLG